MGRWFEASSPKATPEVQTSSISDAAPNSAASLAHNSLLRSWLTDFDLKATAPYDTGRTQGGAAGPASAPCPPGARRSTHRDQGGSHGTQTGCYARQLFSLPLSSSRSCRNGTQSVTLRSAYATNDSGTAPDHGGSEKGGEDRYGSRQLFPVAAAAPGPPHTATDGQSLACAGLSPRFMKHAMRLAAVPRASYAADSRWLNQA
jgi:hypothetical protein